jgi:hypothetical protein
MDSGKIRIKIKIIVMVIIMIMPTIVENGRWRRHMKGTVAAFYLPSSIPFFLTHLI